MYKFLARSLSIPIIDDDEEIIRIISGIKTEEFILKFFDESKKSFSQYNIHLFLISIYE